MTRHDPRLHRFGQPRPSASPPNPQQAPLYKGEGFEPLPSPTGAAPFRLELASVVPDAVAAATRAGGIEFHMVGDTGGVLNPAPQILVADALQHDSTVPGTYGVPAFFYHLGDVIYFDGQAEQYVPQFYDPYAHYDRPILAIPGNHDGAVFDDGERTNPLPSLATFVRNFCAPAAGTRSPDAGEAPRTAMIQPNVYWTLRMPFATIVGLYTNVPEGGVVEAPQAEWFAREIAAAPDDRPLIVALHHPIYSLDVYHSGSRLMAALLADAVESTGRRPSVVFTAHVHNYQRFTVADDAYATTTSGMNGVTPFFVAGNGGYHNLHRMVTDHGAPLPLPYAVPGMPGVTLDASCDNRFGFLRLAISPAEIAVTASVVDPAIGDAAPTVRVIDRMRLDWRARRIIASGLPPANDPWMMLSG